MVQQLSPDTAWSNVSQSAVMPDWVGEGPLAVVVVMGALVVVVGFVVVVLVVDPTRPNQVGDEQIGGKVREEKSYLKHQHRHSIQPEGSDRMSQQLGSNCRSRRG